MKLSKILREDFEVRGDTEIEFNDIQYNSNEVGKGSIFVAIPGHNTDGHNFISEAIQKGAVAVVYEKDRYRPLNNENITWIGVNESRDALAWIADRFYGSPSKSLHLIGITGTNGKTTTSYLIREILKNNGKKTGVIGTIRYLLDEDEILAKHTTPESLQYQHLLSEMVKRGIEYVISEVSSHALSLKRVDYVSFEVAVFTNLSRDHLDFHKDMEDYYRAKRRLFTDLLREDGISVINIDDDYGKRLARELCGNKIFYSNGDKSAHIYVEDYKLMFNGTEIKVSINGESHLFKTSLLGIPNIYNVLSAISVALYLNVPLNTIKSALLNAKAPEGRFENIDEGQNFLVFVDYAHTPDAIERLLKSVIKLREGVGYSGRIITIFGCGGNRDKGKRPQMGRIVSELSDYVILTSDNPRWEEPRQIIRDIEEGILKDNFIVVPERGNALRVGVSMCEKGDILIVAGKGHEDYQEIEGKRLPFSDREVLRKILRELKK